MSHYALFFTEWFDRFNSYLEEGEAVITGGSFLRRAVRRFLTMNRRFLANQ